LHRSLNEKHDIDIQLVYQESGFHFAVKKGDLVEGRLPWGFINPSMQRGKWSFTTMELVSDEHTSNIYELESFENAEKAQCQNERCP
jgi:hypothetical protein